MLKYLIVAIIAGAGVYYYMANTSSVEGELNSYKESAMDTIKDSSKSFQESALDKVKKTTEDLKKQIDD